MTLGISSHYDGRCEEHIVMTTNRISARQSPKNGRVKAPQPNWPKEKSFHLITLLDKAVWTGI